MEIHIKMFQCQQLAQHHSANRMTRYSPFPVHALVLWVPQSTCLPSLRDSSCPPWPSSSVWLWYSQCMSSTDTVPWRPGAVLCPAKHRIICVLTRRRGKDLFRSEFFKIHEKRAQKCADITTNMFAWTAKCYRQWNTYLYRCCKFRCSASFTALFKFYLHFITN